MTRCCPAFLQSVMPFTVLPWSQIDEVASTFFWTDTSASLVRLATGVVLAAVIALAVGIPNGMLPWFGAFWSPTVRAVSMIPPLAILPILFIAFGVGEMAKIILITLGTAPFFDARCGATRV